MPSKNVRAIKKIILGSEFVKNIATLATGTTIAQLISILTAPILYRLFDKDDFGTLGQYMAIVSVISVFSTMQYLQPILLENDDEQAKKVMWLNRLVNLGLTVLITFVVLFFNNHISQLLNNPRIEFWIYLLPLSIFFMGQNDIFRVWANRKKRYRLMTINAIITAITVPLVSISVGLIDDSVRGLFLGLLASQIIPPVILLIGLTRNDDLGLKYLDLNIILSKVKEHQKFPLYNMPSEFINRLTMQLPVFMLSNYAGTGVVGIYNLCTRILGLPVQLISGAIAEVFKQKSSSDYNRKGKFDQILIKTLKLLSLLSLGPFIIILLFAPILFESVFGEEWREAGVLARILGAMFVFKFIASPLSYAFIVTGRLREDFIYHLCMLISNLLIFIIGFKYVDNYRTVLLLFALNNAIIYIIYIFKSYHFSRIVNNAIK